MCGNYTAIVDRHGNNALKGVVAYEGYTACKAPADRSYIMVMILGLSYALCICHFVRAYNLKFRIFHV